MSSIEKPKLAKPQPEIDYYFNEDENLVFTSSYLLRRGYCCGNGCLNCPYREHVPLQGGAGG